jgi:hypothetical protein
MSPHEKLDRNAIKRMSSEEIRQLVQDLRVRTESLNEELRVLQDQIRDSHGDERRDPKRPGL